MPESLFFKKVAGLRRRCYRTPLVAASERNNFIQSNAAKIKKVCLTFQLTFLLFKSKIKESFFNSSVNILIKLLTLDAF